MSVLLDRRQGRIVLVATDRVDAAHGSTERSQMFHLAHPPVVSQTEWDAALTAVTEREKAVAAAMHELAAERKRMTGVGFPKCDRGVGAPLSVGTT